MPDQKRYAVVGTGGRCSMFINAALGDFADHARLVALCDPSPTRMAHWNRRIADKTGEPLPTYAPDDFDRMIEEARPDAVIVTTVDALHHRYIIRALELGCEAGT